MGHEVKEPKSLDFTVKLLEQVLQSRKQGSVPIGKFFEEYIFRKKEKDMKEKEIDKPSTTTIELYPLGISLPKFNTPSSIPFFDSRLIVSELELDSIRSLIQSIYKNGFKIDSSKKIIEKKDDYSLTVEKINVLKEGLSYAKLIYYPKHENGFIVSPQLDVALLLDSNLLKESVKLMRELDSKVEGIGSYYLEKKEKMVAFTHAAIIDPTLKPTAFETMIAYGSIAYGLMSGNYNKELMGNINLEKQGR